LLCIVYRAHVRNPRMQSFLTVEPVDVGRQCFAQCLFTTKCPPAYQLALKTMVERLHVRIVGTEPEAVVASLQAVTCQFFLDGICHELNATICVEDQPRLGLAPGYDPLHYWQDIFRCAPLAQGPSGLMLAKLRKARPN